MSCVEEKDLPLWPAPHAERPVIGAVSVPGSKSMTNRALILAALAAGPSTIVGALRSRDTDLMMDALRSLGARISDDGADIRVDPAPLRGGNIDCGLAGTVMRFVPPVAATATGEVFFDGDAQARTRPMSTMLDALRSLGVQVDGDTLPFTVHGTGSVAGGVVRIDASASSQFISGLLLAGARFENGVTIVHEGASLPSVPHIDMSVDMVRSAGVIVHTDQPNTWVVEPGPIVGCTWRIEPDLSNATPFLAAAAVTGGTVRVHDWPGLHGSAPRDGALRDGALRDGAATTQAGDAIRGILERMGCRVELTAAGDSHDLVVTGPARGGLAGIDIDMSDIGELTPTVAALAALAATPSKLQGIAHLRGHETDRLAALSREINRLGGNCTELDDGLLITPTPLGGGVWHSYADHRMATAGAIIGLVVPGVQVENIATTSKTLPDFAGMWTTLVTTTVQHG